MGFPGMSGPRVRKKINITKCKHAPKSTGETQVLTAPFRVTTVHLVSPATPENSAVPVEKASVKTIAVIYEYMDSASDLDAFCSPGAPGESYGYPGSPGAKGQPGDPGFPGKTPHEHAIPEC